VEDLVKDLSRMNRAKLKKPKMMLDAKGTLHEVPYGKWEQEVINNPNGVTARRAVRDKDPDINNIKVKVLRLKTFGSKEMPKRSRAELPRGQRKTNYNLSTLSPEEAKRMGFRTAEAGKESRQKKKKVKKE